MKNKNRLISIIAVFSMMTGAFGMLFCFTFLWSANLADLVGAGFPFLAGAVLFGTGLIAYTINKKG